MATHHRVLSFDPGITYTGWAFSHYTCEDNILQVIKYGHLQPAKLSKEHKEDCRTYGNQVISLNMLFDVGLMLVDQYRPDFVVSEDAFLNPRLVQAFASLKLCVHTLSMVCFQRQKSLFKMPPCDIKKLVTGSGHADKALIQKTILNHAQITFKQNSKAADPEKMLEHEADAIAVGWAFAQSIPDLVLTTKQK